MCLLWRHVPAMCVSHIWAGLLHSQLCIKMHHQVGCPLQLSLFPMQGSQCEEAINGW